MSPLNTLVLVVLTNKKFVSPTKTSVLSGDTSKLKKTINHKIKYNMDDLVKIMMNDALKKI